jgi:hypothetical protein
MRALRRLAGLPLLLVAFAAQADWRPAGGVMGFIAPHLSLPVTAFAGRSQQLGGGSRLGIGWQSADSARFASLRLTTDGMPGGREAGGDLFAYGIALAAGTEVAAAPRWSLASWGGVGWSMATGAGGAAHDGLEVSAGFAVMRRARMRHIHTGVELSGAWMFEPQGLVLRIGPMIRWRQ